MVMDEIGGVVNLKMANPNFILKTMNPDWSLKAIRNAILNKKVKIPLIETPEKKNVTEFSKL